MVERFSNGRAGRAIAARCAGRLDGLARIAQPGGDVLDIQSILRNSGASSASIAQLDYTGDNMKRSAPKSREAPGERLSLFVFDVEEGLKATFQLGDRGTVTIGRAAANDVQLKSSSLAPHHAELEIGPPLRIRDLGSKRGTVVGERRLGKGESAPLELDELVELGSTMLFVQRQVAPLHVLQLWDHDHFSALVEHECRRAGEGEAFSLIHLRCGDAAAVVAALTELLRPSDVAGQYADDQWEVLLTDRAGADARSFVEQVGARLRKAGLAAPPGVAQFPLDGRNGEELLATAAGRALGGETRPPIATGPTSMQALRHFASMLAASDVPILLLGETGVGKEEMARWIHDHSKRSGRPFQVVSCVAFSENLLESELFGHEAGSFTGAKGAKPGQIELAEGGTLFLDEIGELTPGVQAKLLRVLESYEVQRVGATRSRRVDIRLIAATSRDLDAAMAQGAFKLDLYHRLGSDPLTIPPLRERRDEVDALAAGFIRKQCEHLGRARMPVVDPSAIELLRRFDWPGNIRELKNVIDRAVVLSDGAPSISIEHLPRRLANTFPIAAPPPAPPRSPPAAPRIPAPPAAAGDPAPTAPAAAPPAAPRSMREEMAALERQRILDALARAGGNQTRAASELGISRRTLVSRLDEYGVPRPKKGRA
jgi:DNA-binding NtrC family response regulator